MYEQRDLALHKPERAAIDDNARRALGSGLTNFGETEWIFLKAETVISSLQWYL